MKSLIIITCLLLPGSVYSQHLIPEAVKIKTAFEKLSGDTSNKNLQKNYIDSFPSDAKTFLQVFQPRAFDQLYTDSHKYLEAFQKCADNFPIEVISKCVDIGKNLVWDADAVGQLQQMSVAIAAKHVNVFISKYKSLSMIEQDSLINFYADVENHSAYPEYQDLIDALNLVGQKDISAKLETAIENRKKQRDH